MASAKPNFSALWVRAAEVAAQGGHQRLSSLLQNHKDQRERICRKLGIICEADIVRFQRDLRVRKHRT